MSGDNTQYSVDDAINTQANWEGQSFILNLADTSLLPKGTSVKVADDFSNVTFKYPNGTIVPSGTPTLAGNGLLSIDGETPFDTETANGRFVAAGTPLLMVFSMIVIDDPNGDEVDRHFTVLTLVDDPEDAGVMGGSDGGGTGGGGTPPILNPSTEAHED